MTAPVHPPTSPPAGDERAAQNDRLLLQFLQTNDAPCPVCGYNVRKLTRPICPECHHRLSLMVGVRDLPLRWLLIAIAPGFFSGIAAVLLSIPIVMMPLAGNGSAPAVIIITDLFGYLSGFVAIMIAVSRKRFFAKRLDTQRNIAIIMWVIHVSALGILILLNAF